MENNSRQLIAIKRLKVFVSLTKPAEFSEERKNKLIAITKELARFGYSLSPKALQYLSEKDLEDIFNETLQYLKEEFYPGDKWCPLYPGFPEQVISKDEDELWRDQHKLYDTLDYQAFLDANGWYTEEETNSLEEAAKKVGTRSAVLNVLTERDLLDIFKSILASGNSLAKETRDELEWFLVNYPTFELPEKIPFKETMCIVMSHRSDCKARDINDVLRYGIYLMGGNPELVHVPKSIRSSAWSRQPDAENPEWRNLKASRKVRKEILSKLEDFLGTTSFGVCIPDAKRFYGHWIVLSERVHPSEYESQFPSAAKFFRFLKSKSLSKKYRTWNSIVQEKYNKAEDVLEIAKFISSRPGEFVRKFDSLLRRAATEHKESDIMDIFLETEGMKNKTLLELRNYYERRSSRCPRMVRTIMDGKPKVHTIVTLDPLPLEIVETNREFIERKILLNIADSIKEKDLENSTVYLDPTIKNIPIPSSMRDSMFVVPTTTRYDIPEDKKYIRMFIHWIQKPGRDEDLDLHAYLYKNEQEVVNVGFNTGLKFSDIAVHSGDVLNREGDCAEYVDINIDKAKEAGYRYIVMDVYNYKGREFDTLDNWLGYTTLESMESPRKDWKPENVDFCQKISVQDTGIAAWIFDTEKRQAILLGVGISGIPVNHGNQNSAIVKFFAEEPKFTSYDVLKQYYKSRGANIIEDIAQEHDIEVKQEDIIHDYTKVLEILG